MRLYVGGLSYKVTQAHVWKLFSEFGIITDIELKSGYVFVEFKRDSAAENAIHELHNKSHMGLIMRVSRGYRRQSSDRLSGERRCSTADHSDDSANCRNHHHDHHRSAKHRSIGRETRITRYRLGVDNLSTCYTWRDLKHKMGDEATHAEAHVGEKRIGYVYFSNHTALRSAKKRLQNRKLNGRRLILTDQTSRKRSRTRSPSSLSSHRGHRSSGKHRHHRHRGHHHRRRRETTSSSSTSPDSTPYSNSDGHRKDGPKKARTSSPREGEGGLQGDNPASTPASPKSSSSGSQQSGSNIREEEKNNRGNEKEEIEKEAGEADVEGVQERDDELNAENGSVNLVKANGRSIK